MHVSLTPAVTEEERQIVRNFFLAFFYDLTQYDDNLIINAHGLPMWLPSGLPGPRTPDECVIFNWWVRDSCQPYIIRADGNPAGFLHILDDRAHLVPEVDYELLDFYIAPKYRRYGVGTQAARFAFDLFAGRWQVFELARNAPALAFWHKLIGEYTQGVFQDLDNGTQQRFDNSGRHAAL